MKKGLTISGVIIFALIILTSCGERKKKETIDLTVNVKDSITKTDTNIINAPLESLESVPTIKIGQQEWMTEDINATYYNNGDLINEAKTEKKWKENGNKKLGCYRKLSNGTYVYNGFAINDKRGIMPLGFILPTYDQYNQLIKFLGGGDAQTGIATKSMATYPLHYEEWVGDQETGGLEGFKIKANGNSKFKAKKGGFVYDFGTTTEGNCSYWWTASSEGANIIVVDIGYCSQDLGGGKGVYPSSYGFAVRAMRRSVN
jgi:uncharacterized protein (TIGR02145 family)